MSLGAGESIQLDFTAPVPDRMRRPNAFWSVSLEPDSEDGLHGLSFVVNYRIAGLLTFPKDRILLETKIGQTSRNFRVPILISEPVTPEHIVVHLLEEFEEIEAAVVLDGEKAFLSLDISPEMAQSKYVAGEIGCMDTTTGIEDTVYCVIKRQSVVSVFPAVLRATGNENKASISAVVRVERLNGNLQRNSDAETRKSNVEETPKSMNSALIDAMIGEQLLKAEQRRISDSVYRVKVMLTDKNLQSLREMAKPQITWSIRTSKKAHQLTSNVRLP